LAMTAGKQPEITAICDTLSSPYVLDFYPHIFRYVSIMRAFLKEAVPFIQNYSTYFSTLQEMYGLS